MSPYTYSTPFSIGAGVKACPFAYGDYYGKRTEPKTNTKREPSERNAEAVSAEKVREYQREKADKRPHP